MHGLMRVRGFTQDDAHIFCLPSQLQDEIAAVLDLVDRVLQRFGFSDFDVMLSTRPKESVGDDAIWDASTAALKGALAAKGWAYGVDEGGGAFYGPKIDIKIRDAIGRKWQCSTIQCDFNLPVRFDMEYTAADGSKQRPVMVHRAVFGSLERFFGVLLEHTVGDLPLWLAPEQLRLLPVTDEAHEYCHELKRRAEAKWPGLRVSVDESGERLGKQIRIAEQQKVPLMAVIGKRELASKDGSRSIPVRSHRAGDLGEAPADRVFEAMQAAVKAYQEVSAL
jgi:threonyl-tRNA synthetase